MNAPDILSYGHRDLLATFEKISDQQWSVGVNTTWTVRDVLAHMASYETLLEDALKFVAGQSPTPMLDDMGRDQAGFNDRQVAARKDKSSAELLDELRRGHEHVLALVNTFGPEKLRQVGTIPWYGKEYSLDDFIVYANYAHIREHVGQVKLALQRAV